MARSKNLHFVNYIIEVQQPDPNPSMGNWVEGSLQIDIELSQELGRTIRNGNSFRLVGYGSALRGFSSGSDLDVGFAGTTIIEYCPVTKNGVGAWQSLQKQWIKQKQLSSKVGKYVRYDDFEVGWSPGNPLTAARQTTIRMTGLADTNAEAIVLYGSSVDGAHVTLEEYYDNLNPIPVPSENPFGAVIKTAKFTNKFPNYNQLVMPCAFSANAYDTALGTGYAGAISMGEIQWLPSDNHLSHMTGTLHYYFKGLAPDTDTPPATPDELRLLITLVYEGWAPLAKVRSARGTTQKQLTTAASPKRTTRARRKS